MKHYINPVTQEVFAYEADGSQDEYIQPGLLAVADADLPDLLEWIGCHSVSDPKAVNASGEYTAAHHEKMEAHTAALARLAALRQELAELIPVITAREPDSFLQPEELAGFNEALASIDAQARQRLDALQTQIESAEDQQRADELRAEEQQVAHEAFVALNDVQKRYVDRVQEEMRKADDAELRRVMARRDELHQQIADCVAEVRQHVAHVPSASTVIKIDIAKAREAKKQRLRAQRAPLLEQNDRDYMSALKSGADTAAIVAEQQRLKDITKLADKAKSLEALRAISC